MLHIPREDTEFVPFAVHLNATANVELNAYKFLSAFAPEGTSTSSMQCTIRHASPTSCPILSSMEVHYGFRRRPRRRNRGFLFICEHVDYRELEERYKSSRRSPDAEVIGTGCTRADPALQHVAHQALAKQDQRSSAIFSWVKRLLSSSPPPYRHSGDMSSLDHSAGRTEKAACQSVCPQT